MTNTKLQCIWRDGCNQPDACKPAECCQGLRSNREKAEQVPSKDLSSERVAQLIATLKQWWDDATADNNWSQEDCTVADDTIAALRQLQSTLEPGALHEIPWQKPVADWPDIVAAIRSIYPRDDHKGCGEIALAAATEIEKLRAAQPTSPEPGMHRNQVIARARMAHGGKWPAELTSGVMFYEGMRVTREDFEHR